MPFTLIRHKVANYAKWKRAVHEFKKFRKAGGEKCFHVARGMKNKNDLVVWCSWSNTAKMKKFIKSPELRKAMKAAGIVGKPEIQLYDGLEDLSV